ncbi:hypothetical protein ACNQKP_11135 [Bdellovibrio bacteriovorus]|uniref:hypothetical protein n=1 Tax=Bdellovibrio bacteriovorus TaxID=959 RepID=UPI003AA95EE2
MIEIKKASPMPSATFLRLGSLREGLKIQINGKRHKRTRKARLEEEFKMPDAIIVEKRTAGILESLENAKEFKERSSRNAMIL